MKLIQLKYFVEVVDCRSINKAAEKLFISQPALSRTIRTLEEEMKKELIVRSNHGITVTSSGQIFYYYARSILNQMEVLERLRDLDEEELFSRLSISVSDIFLKDDMILEFYYHMRSIDTEIHFTETTAEMVLSNVEQGKSEIGIVILNTYQAEIFQKMAEIKGIELDVWDESPLLVHVSEKYPLGQKEEIEVKELLEYIYLHLPDDFYAKLNQSLEIDGVQLTDLTRNISMSNYHAIINMLNKAKTFHFGHKWQKAELEKAHIRSVTIKHCEIKQYLGIIKRKNEILSKEASVFLAILKEDFENI